MTLLCHWKSRRFTMNPFMKIAIDEARVGIEHKHGGPFGAVVVKDGKVVGAGHNQVFKNADPTCHGEMMAIRDACKNLGTFDLTGCEIYTTGYPCPMCMGAIQWSNMTKCYYACNLEDTEKIGFRDDQFYNNPLKPEECDRAEGLVLYEEYVKSTDVRY